MAKRLRLALTISGAVSLGSYEGGVLAALLSAVRPLCQGTNPTVRVDAIGGASAGSITGLLAARALTEGLDPVHVMREAWVVRDSITRMLRGLQDAPLSSDALRAMAEDLLDPARVPAAGGHQTVPVRITMMLAALRGLEYRVTSLVSTTDVTASTYVDLVTATIKNGLPVSALLEPEGSSLVDVALASGANALGFPPKVLDRNGDKDRYRDLGIVNFPASGHLWYTDGGTLDNEPLGHTLDLVGQVDRPGLPDNHAGDFARMLVLIHPHPTAAPNDDEWADPAEPPTWLATLLRSDHLQRTQSLYDDLRRVEKTNTRLEWLDRLTDAVGPLVDGLPDTERTRLAEALSAVRAEIDADRRSFTTHHVAEADERHAPAPGAAAEPVAEAADPRSLLRSLLGDVAGVSGKQKVALEVISPLVLPEARTTPVERMLAGEVLAHFGGFFDERLRTSDFDLGYRSVTAWLEAGGLSRNGLSHRDSDRALASAKAAYQPGETWQEWGDKGVGYLATRHPIALAGLLAQFARVAGQDVITHHLRQRR